MPPPQAAAPKRRSRTVAAVVAVLAVAAGAVVTVVALGDAGSSGGAASPQAAVNNVVSAINDSDVLGMLDALAPAERRAIADPLVKDFAELKRTHVFSADADLSHLDGASATFRGLTYGSDITINDHLRVVQITGGTLHVDSDLSRLPISSEFLKTLGVGGLSGTRSQTVDLAKAVRENHGKPIAVAAENVDGGWYPSLLYTIAYYAVDAAGLPQPSAADAIPAVGANSPEEAVRQLVYALLGGDVTGAIKLASPDELAVLHDYGGVLLRQIGGGYPAAPVQLDQLDLTTESGPDGSQLVSLHGFAARVDNGGQVAMQLDGDCVQLTFGDHTQRMCSDQITRQLDQLFDHLTGRPLTAGQRQALNDFSGVSSLGGGIVTTQVSGQWFVNPIQTFLGGTTSLLERFQDNDLLELIGLFKQLAVSQSVGAMGGVSGGVVCITPSGQRC
jgi:hypothetical protein